MEGFGQTETTLTVATMPWMEPKPGSMGLPNPQYDVDLIDHEGRSVEAGEQGQIVIRTNKGKPLGLFKEYYRDAKRTHEAWHDGIYYTGDVAGMTKTVTSGSLAARTTSSRVPATASARSKWKVH